MLPKDSSKAMNIPSNSSLALEQTTLDDLAPLDCKTPSFRNQNVLDKQGLYPIGQLSDGSYLGVIHNILSPSERITFLEEAVKVRRIQGPPIMMGHYKPRAEVCYTPTGAPMHYSGKPHYTVKLPDHIRTIIPHLLTSFQKLIPSTMNANEFTEISDAVDILYSSELKGGGSVSAHKDDENKDWGLILIMSFGQSRYLRVRDDDKTGWWNVKLRDNSLVAMYGANFQKNFTHQIDKLHKNEPTGSRLSINIRFIPQGKEPHQTAIIKTKQKRKRTENSSTDQPPVVSKKKKKKKK